MPSRTRGLYKAPISYLVRCLNNWHGPPPERLEEDDEDDLDVDLDEEDEFVTDDDNDDDDWMPYR